MLAKCKDRFRDLEAFIFQLVLHILLQTVCWFLSKLNYKCWRVYFSRRVRDIYSKTYVAQIINKIE